jgi:hypothetical protein
MDFFIGGAIKTGTRQDYLDFVLPGSFIVMAGFAAVTTALGVASDMLQGVVDRFRTLPMAKSAVIAGHVISDLPRALIGLAATIGFGLLIGFRSPAGAGPWAAAISSATRSFPPTPCPHGCASSPRTSHSAKRLTASAPSSRERRSAITSDWHSLN